MIHESVFCWLSNLRPAREFPAGLFLPCRTIQKKEPCRLLSGRTRFWEESNCLWNVQFSRHLYMSRGVCQPPDTIRGSINVYRRIYQSKSSGSSPCFPFYDWIIVLNSLTIYIIKLLTADIALIQSIIVVEIRFTSLAADSLQDLKSSLQICRTNIVFWVQNKSNIRSECCNKSRCQRRYSAAGTDRSHFWYRDRDSRGNEDVLKASR